MRLLNCMYRTVNSVKRKSQQCGSFYWINPNTMEKINFNLDKFLPNIKNTDLFGKPVFEKIDRRKGITNERQVIIQTILEELAKEKIKPILPKLLKQIKNAGIKTNFQLYQIISESKDYRNRKGSFAKCFYGILKNRYEKILNDKNNTAKNEKRNG